MAERAADGQLERRKRRQELLEGTTERRDFRVEGLEVRETSDGGIRFSGYPSVTETFYEVGDFQEKLARNAFKRTLGEKPDVPLLVNHTGIPLARTSSGTLALVEDARGLKAEADLDPSDPNVQAILPAMRRGDITEMSFAFRATEQEWSEDRSQRVIRSVNLHRGDVSIVTMGANSHTTAEVSIRSEDGEYEVRVGKALSKAKEKQIKDLADKLAEAGDELSGLLPPEPEPDPVSVWEGLAALPDLTTRAAQQLQVVQ